MAKRGQLVPGHWRIPILAGSMALTVAAYVPIVLARSRGDAFAYYTAWQHGLYDERLLGDAHAYLYSPAFAQLIWPLTLLQWDVFYVLWTALLLSALLWLVGPFLIGFILVLFYPAALSIANGNVHLLLAVVVALGLRYPVAWSFALLTKVTPGIGLLWFLVRREWRGLGMALGATLAFAAVSAALEPDLWTDWAVVLFSSVGRSGAWPAADIPLLPRLPVAALAVLVGALTNRRWLVPVGVVAALPMIALESGVILLAGVHMARQAGRGLAASAGVAALVVIGWMSFVVVASLLGLKGGPG